MSDTPIIDSVIKGLVSTGNKVDIFKSIENYEEFDLPNCKIKRDNRKNINKDAKWHRLEIKSVWNRRV